MDVLVKRIDREIAAVEKRIKAERERHAARVAPLAERQRQLADARKALVKTLKAKPKRARKGSTVSVSRAKAGPAAISRVRESLADVLHGQATQARITAETGLNSGQVSAALKELENEGVVRKTGKKEGRSHEFELIGSGQ